MNYKTKKLNIRNLQTQVHEWGEHSKPKLFLLHGWMDCGATFKYMASDLAQHFHIIAPDLRGFGDTEHPQEGYWFPDYFADLDALITHYMPVGRVNLAGHSMGGNIAYLYAGVQPQRVAKVMSIDSLGLPQTDASQAPEKYRRWLRETLSEEPSKIYPNVEMLMHSIYKGNPTLSREMIEDLVELWGKPVGDEGAMMLKHDHRHRYTNPVRYNFDDTLEIWKQVEARVGLMMASESMHTKFFVEGGRLEQAKQALRISENDLFVVEKSNHMVHLEQPQQTASYLIEFFS